MKRRKGNKWGTGLIIIASVLFLMMKIDWADAFSFWGQNVSLLPGYIESHKRGNFTTQNVINQYLPIVGYVETHYVDTSFDDDPSYKYEPQLEYLTLNMEDETDAEQENMETQAAQETSVPVTLFPVKANKNELADFKNLLSNFYTVTSITELKEDTFDVNSALNEDLTLKGDASNPQILIFHTHSQETFADSTEGDPSTSIVGVGARLAELLSSKYGYNVIHDTSVYDYVNGVLDRSKAYTYAEQGIQSILNQYPTIEVILDIHRDGVNENVRLVTDVDGKPTAKIMFFNGISYTKVNGRIDYLKNPYIQDNLAMSLQMQMLGNTYYPDLLRKIYINGYRYCLHFREKSMLIEVGAQNNTLQEELNAMEPLADMLNRLFTGEKGYE